MRFGRRILEKYKREEQEGAERGGKPEYDPPHCADGREERDYLMGKETLGDFAINRINRA